METIISAAISASVTLIVCIITQSTQAKKTEVLIEYRLLELEKKVDKHNNLIERTHKLEEQNLVQDEQIKQLKERLA